MALRATPPLALMMRMTPKRWLKSLALVCAAAFVFLHMRALVDDDDAGLAPAPLDPTGLRARAPPDQLSGVPHLNLVVYKTANGSTANTHARQAAPPVLHYPHPAAVSPDNRTAIREYVARANAAQRIANLDRFDLASSGGATVVVVVQVHDRVDYLRHLIDSLRGARHIENTLLIFSHDHYDPHINSLVAEVNFTLAMQIFYPHSIQMYPDQFPGTDPADCGRDVKHAEAVKLQCPNANNSDKYGHYREAKYAQTKHHWFWKMNHVFDGLDVMRHYNGPVLLLEEDHYVTEDFLAVLLKMYRFKETACSDCNIFTLGVYAKKPTYVGSIASTVNILNWLSTNHNMGMSLNRQVWQSIHKCAEKFCSFDDYNWDWSLQFISMTCTPKRLRVMVVQAPRVYHIGECGVHHKGKNCNPRERVAQIENLLSVSKASLFPGKLSVAGYPRTPTRLPKPNGGWGDKRDHALCLSFASQKAIVDLR